MTLQIIHKEKDFLIINKPVGLLVHPTETSKEPTLVDLLLKFDPAIAKVGDPKRPGIVHRLDRETSGLMIVARTSEMYNYLKEKFATREIKKEYLALLHGKLPKDFGEINFTISRSRRGGRMAAGPTESEGRAAKTSYDVLKRWPHLTLVRAMPETGRTHQIRAHFHGLGHPVVGDPLYQTKKQKITKSRNHEIKERLMLHAWKLSFRDPAGHDHTFESPLPPEFDKIIKVT